MTILEPLDHHALLLFWLQLLLLLTVARGLGLLAQRVGQPAVIGELTAGLLVGPSVLGRLAPAGLHWLFPGDPASSGMLLAVAWIGVVLLLVETGFETDLRLLRRIGRSTAMVPIGSLVVPLGFGVAMGFAMPDTFVAGGRTLFALFMGVALAISALPVVAKILIELGLMRRNVGQVIVVAGMADDIVGWIMLTALTGAAASGYFDPSKLALTIVLLAAFLVLAFTFGQRATNAILRRSLQATGDRSAVRVSAAMVVVLVFASLTQAIGIEAVFGAFVAGIVISRSRYFTREVEQTVHAVSHGVFAPIFFATAGLYVDLGRLADPTIATWAVIVIVVASLGKLSGSYIGARLGPLGHREAIAVGVGLNARGALEIIIATIALSIGVFNQSAYTVVVLLAITTSMAAPPLLRWALSNIHATEDEETRLREEDLLARSVVAKARAALLPTRGGANSAVAARILDLALRPDAHVTLFTAEDVDDPDLTEGRRRIEAIRGALGNRASDLRRATTSDPAAAILAEASLGHDLMALGLTENFRGTATLSERLRTLLAGTSTPILLVRRAAGALVDPAPPLAFDRILVAVTGTVAGRAAEEIAHSIARRTGAEVDLLHVLSRTDRRWGEETAASGQLSRAQIFADRFGTGASSVLRVGSVTSDEILAAARDRDSDLIVLGADLRRDHDGNPFLGHGTEYVVEQATATVVVVVLPPNG